MKTQKLQILLVEDGSSDVEAVCRAFRPYSENTNISIALNIFEAKAYLAESNPDIVITDLFLPDGSGMELLATEKNDPGYPMIVMSGMGDEEKAVEVMKRGAFDYLVKSKKSLAFIPTIVRMVLREWETLQEKKQAEIEMIKAKEKADRASQAKSEFLARVSHELRTPMNSILGFGQVLNMNKENNLTENQKDNVKYILKAGSHLLTLINDLLDVSQIESGKITMVPENVNIMSLLDDLIILLMPLTNEKNIKITNQLSDDSEGIAWADLGRLKQVLLNLIGNAIKYNQVDGSIVLECEKPSEGRICIKVKDTGEGISKENINDIFQPFHRLEGKSAFVEGTGIGLNIAKGFVESMDGTIKVDSVLGEGSCFTIDLPIGKA